MNTLFLICLTTVTGVVGTGIGGLAGVYIHRKSDRSIHLLLSYASGIMLSIVCFDLIPDALEADSARPTFHLGLTLLGLAGGALLVYLLNKLIERKTGVAHTHEHGGHHHGGHGAADRASLRQAGFVMAAAIAVHNITLGMSIGAPYADASTHTGAALTLALMIGIHNIPEGMSVVVPLIGGGLSAVRAVILTALCGTPIILGAVLGYLIGDIGPTGLSLSLGVASGAMLFVIFGEIMPEAMFGQHRKLPTFFVLFGIMTGLLIIYL